MLSSLDRYRAIRRSFRGPALGQSRWPSPSESPADAPSRRCAPSLAGSFYAQSIDPQQPGHRQLSQDPRFPSVSKILYRHDRRPEEPLPRRLRRQAAGLASLEVVCCPPIDHHRTYEKLHHALGRLRRIAGGNRLSLHFRSHLRQTGPFEQLPVDELHRLPMADRLGDRVGALRAAAGSGLVLLSPTSRWRLLAGAWPATRYLGALHLPSIPVVRDGEAARGAIDLQRAMLRQTPEWVAGRPSPAAIELAGSRPRLLVHQARFHIGDALWLTPLLRALRDRYAGARITVVAPPAAGQALAGCPAWEEFIAYRPGGRREAARRLSGRAFDLALFAFARRPESRWLARAAAATGTPYRINLEYYDPLLDHRSIDPSLTHEAWFFWGSMASPEMLLHALDPLRPPAAANLGVPNDDRRVEYRLAEGARKDAADLLTALGIGDDKFAILAPGGFSSPRWPEWRFAELALRLADEKGLHVLIEGGRRDRPVLQSIAGMLRLDPQRQTGRRIEVREDSLTELCGLLARARLLVSNDSAPIHLAEALGTPTIYFATYEKLVHSHPAGDRCWALVDGTRDDPRQLGVEAVLAVLDEIARNGKLRRALPTALP